MGAMPQTPPEPLPIHLSPEEARLLLLHIMPRCHVCTHGHQEGGLPATRVAIAPHSGRGRVPYCDAHTLLDWWHLFDSTAISEFRDEHDGKSLPDLDWTFTDLPLASLVRRLQGLVEGQASR